MPNNGALNSASITLYDIFLNMPLYDEIEITKCMLIIKLNC